MIRPELKKILLIFSAWIIFGGLMWMLTRDIRALWISAACILITILIAGIVIALIRMGAFSPVIVHIKGKSISGCSCGCPYLKMQDNLVNKNFPVSKCSAKGMKTIYQPSKVPRWCPYNG